MDQFVVGDGEASESVEERNYLEQRPLRRKQKPPGRDDYIVVSPTVTRHKATNCRKTS